MAAADRRKTKQQLMEELAELRVQAQIVANVAEGVMVARDIDNVIIETNGVFDAMFGYRSGELIGKHVSTLNDPQEQPPEQTVAAILDSLAKEGMWQGRVANIRKDGSRFWTTASVSHFDHFKHGTVTLTLQRDITEHKRLEEELRRRERELQTLLDHAPDIIARFDREFRHLYINAAVEGPTGTRPRSIIGRTISEVGLPDWLLAKWLGALRSVFDTGEPTTIEIENPSPLGTKHYVARLVPELADDGSVETVLSISQDVTERKKAEEELERHYALERGIRQELEAERDKRIEFTRVLVHELKTPITPVLAATELLLQQLEDETSLRLVESIERSASNLERRIDDFMDLIRGETDMLSLYLAPLNLVLLLENLGQEMVLVAKNEGHSLIVDLPSAIPEVQGDGDRLRQVVQNLLNNAVKYAPMGGEISLTARADRTSVVVEVHDTGHGMTEEDLERLFSPYFRRVEDRERLGGLGLGLALSKKLVELHGGEMWAMSKKGQGTTFGFSLPLDRRDDPVRRGSVA